MTAPFEVAAEFILVLDELAIPYAVMGGLAVRIHALPRPTFDVDFTVAADESTIQRLVTTLDERGYSMPPSQSAGWTDLVREMPVVKFQWFVDGKPIDIDVFLAETPFQKSLLSRRQRHGTEELEAWFVSVEDLILLKLLAGRRKDQVDIQDILLVQGPLDETYLRDWADRLGVRRELEAALMESRA